MPHLPALIEQAWPPEAWIDVHVVAAVSGGPDSMALVLALLDVKRRCGGRGSLLAAHVHHGLHAEADADEAWLTETLERLQIPLTVYHVDTRQAAANQGDGLEAAARSLRHAALQSAAEHAGARFVALGHTADDQVETILHRIVRGTGIKGLAGMPRQRPLGATAMLVRPLLDITRRDVLRYLAALGQPFREDPTNRDASFTRNRVRSKLLPLLRREFNPRTDDAVLRLARQAEELTGLMRLQVAALLEEAVDVSAARVVIYAARLRREPEPLVREVLRGAWREAGWPEQPMSDAAWRKLSQLLHEESTRTDLPGGIEVEVSRGTVRLSRPRT